MAASASAPPRAVWSAPSLGMSLVAAGAATSLGMLVAYRARHTAAFKACYGLTWPLMCVCERGLFDLGYELVCVCARVCACS